MAATLDCAIVNVVAQRHLASWTGLGGVQVGKELTDLGSSQNYDDLRKVVGEWPDWVAETSLNENE